MPKKCLGCGIILQNTNENELGYTPNLAKDFCVRCFKMRNYNTLIKEASIDNTKLLININKTNYFTCFLIDYLTICSESMRVYQQIKNNKCLIITKKDLLPKNLHEEKIIHKVKEIYGIKDNVYFITIKEDLAFLANIINDNHNVLITGFTVSGKSSLINTITDSKLTISKSLNTTLDFIKIPYNNNYIYDTPGFVYLNFYPNINFKKSLKPMTKYLDSKTELIIDKIIIHSNILNNITLFIPNYLHTMKRKTRQNYKSKINIPKNSDLVIKGLGFIYFKDACILSLNEDYGSIMEIRDSIVSR